MPLVMKKSRESGFTLAELLVVIIIIGILAAIAIPVFLNQRQRANDSELQTNVRSLSQTVEDAMISYPNAQYFALAGGAGRVQVRVGNSINDYATTSLAIGKDTNIALVAGDSAGSYSIYAYRGNGKQYKSISSALLYDSLGGGMSKEAVSITTARKNLATNGSAETSFANESWEPYYSTPFQRTTAEAKEGTYSLELTIDESRTKGIWVRPSASYAWAAGDEVTARVWVKAPAGTSMAFGLRTATDLGAGVGAQLWNASGDWEKKTISYTLPDTPNPSYYPQVITRSPFPPVGTKIYIDGFMMEAGSTTQDDYIEDSVPGDISSGAWVKVS